MNNSTTIEIALISHTNAGKTTLARTLLGRDIGEVRDAPHVTEIAESHVLLKTDAGDQLLLWDTPGFGDSARLVQRLRLADNPIGWFLREVWDRYRDRPFWCSQQALRAARDNSDVILYLVNAAEDPRDAGYVASEAQVLRWVGKPIVVLLNQIGPPRPAPEERAEQERWRAHMHSLSIEPDVLTLDAFARCWVQERVLLDAIGRHLPPEKQAAYARLVASWTARSIERFRASMHMLAEQLAHAAIDHEPVAAASASATQKVMQSIGLRKDEDPARERAMQALAERLDARIRAATATLINLHALEGTLFGFVVQVVHGVAKLRLAGASQRAFAQWVKDFHQQQGLRQQVQSLQDALQVITTILPTVAAVGLFWCATELLTPLQTGTVAPLTTGTFVAFYAAFGACIQGATSLSRVLVEVLDITTLWERAHPILAAPSEGDRTKRDPGRLSGQVAFAHVTFRYHPHGPLILDDVSLSAAPGEFIAIVGPSGGGKSTLFRLLLGFETPQGGTMTYDGQDLSQLDVYAVRRQIGVVLQQSRLMAGTMFDNIASGAVITMDEAWEAARAAGLAEDIAAMPMGMHTMVSESGGNVSGGQRQRILMARALVCHPRLLLLDEATSALDNHTQALVTANLERLHVTRIVIAHRLSTIRHATRIYVLAGGRIVQQGCFAELAQQEGMFAQLMARQLLTAPHRNHGKLTAQVL